ncbi:MAG: hypothetical protein WC337_06365 [Candidatus Muiribacteriota bacterium]
MRNFFEKIKHEFIIEPVKYFYLNSKKRKYKSQVIIVLHFNQSYSDYFQTAWEKCYKPLLQKMAELKGIKLLVNFSLTFLEGVNSTQEGRDLLKKIILNPDYALIQSLPGQHVPGILDKKIEFGLIPPAVGNNAVFWIPERTWDINFLKMLDKKGYKYVFVEHMDNVSKKIRIKRLGNLFLIPDEIKARHFLDALLLYGRHGFKLKNFILRKKLTVWAEDAEVAGLWSYERKEDFKKPLERFMKFFEWIKSNSQVEAVFPWEVKGKKEKITDYAPFVMGNKASWIEDSFRGIINQFYEKGFDSFESYINGDKIQFFKNLIENYYTRINSQIIPQFVQCELMKILYFYMYEFGCPGVGFEDKYLWAGIQKVEKYLILFEKIINYENGFYDINTQGNFCKRKIFCFKFEEHLYMLDCSGQIVSYINIRNSMFCHNDLIFTLNSHYDYDRNAVFLINREKKQGSYEFENNRVIFNSALFNLNIDFNGLKFDYVIKSKTEDYIMFSESFNEKMKKIKEKRGQVDLTPYISL